MRYRLELIFAMLIFGTLGLITQYIPMSGFGISFIRSIFGLLFFLVYKGVQKEKVDWIKIRQQLPQLLLSGVFLSLSWIFLFTAFRIMPVGQATILYYTAPVIIMLYGMVFEHEGNCIPKIIAILFCLLGLIMTIGIPESAAQIQGIGCALIAALAYALYVIFGRKTTMSITTKNLVQFSVSLLMTFPLFLWHKDYAHTFPVSAICAMLVIGIIHTGLAYFLYVQAISYLKSSEISIMSYIDPLTSFLVSILILRETTTPLMAMGAGIMLLSLIGYQLSDRVLFLKKRSRSIFLKECKRAEQNSPRCQQ